MPDTDLVPDADLARPATTDQRRALRLLVPGAVAHILPGGAEMGDAVPATVHDVSSFGIGLRLARRIEFGSRLLIDLENATRGVVHTVLARVVHATPHPDGGWVIGCALIGELDEEGLTAFDAGRVRPASGDSRAWVRFPCGLRTTCQAFDASPSEPMTGRILNISAGGLGLLVPCQFETKTLLTLDLPSAAEGQSSRVLVRVVQARLKPSGNWYLGCEFVDWFADEEVTSLCQ